MKDCRICGNSDGNRAYTVREMMFGFRDEFRYFECSNCGCVQIEDVPDNFAKYYPQGYYSFSQPGALKSFLKRQWALTSFGRWNPIGRLLATVMGENQAIASLRRAGIPLSASILDVGCGGGDLLMDLLSIGFTDLTGIDPFNEQDLLLQKSVRIFKREISKLKQEFDVAMFHHSFEHMPNPREAFGHLSRTLKPNGTVIIRLPVAAFAWKEYGPDWVQLDAPRHIFVPTERSMAVLAAQFGFRIENVIYESTDFQFWGSEQYKQDIPLRDRRSRASASWRLLVPNATIRMYRMRARELNELKLGDSACFYLVRGNSGD